MTLSSWPFPWFHRETAPAFNLTLPHDHWVSNLLEQLFYFIYLSMLYYIFFIRKRLIQTTRRSPRASRTATLHFCVSLVWNDLRTWYGCLCSRTSLKSSVLFLEQNRAHTLQIHIGYAPQSTLDQKENLPNQSLNTATLQLRTSWLCSFQSFQIRKADWYKSATKYSRKDYKQRFSKCQEKENTKHIQLITEPWYKTTHCWYKTTHRWDKTNQILW
jgi:hypothetical protein